MAVQSALLQALARHAKMGMQKSEAAKHVQSVILAVKHATGSYNV